MSHMLEEIREQPGVVRGLISSQRERVTALAAAVRERRIVYSYVAARGTSDHAAIYGKYVLETRSRMPMALAAPSVMTLYDVMPEFGDQALILGISQSGAGPDIVEVVRRARDAGLLTACITNEEGSDLAKTAEHPLLISAGKELSVAATKTYTGSLALLALFAIALSGRESDLDDLRRAADAMEAVLELSDEIRAAADQYRDVQECVVLGRGYNLATAFEISLKLIETCYLGAKAYSSADFQHGPIAQISTGFPVLLFAPEGRAFDGMVDMADRLRSRHPALIACTHDPDLLALSKTPIAMPANIPEWVSPLVYAVAGQLFAYWLAIARGNDPDVPRGLNKVTKTL